MISKGQLINERYKILKSVGEGGMANVYLAHDTILDRDVAVKVLRGDLSNDEKFIRRFQREALSASSLNHDNIVQMYDVGEEDGQYYIVMEFVEGKTLSQLIKKRGFLTVPEVVDIMQQLTAGLACAHDSYIIHRDIKSQNILVLDNGMVKITDFGVAMAMNSTQLTQTNTVMGSVHYLPPEQANGKGSTMKSDIYSLGILMYELLTGKKPFSGDNAVEIALKHMRDPIPSVRAENNKIPQSIENVILKACAKNPKNRYNDVKEMHQDLETVLNEDRLNEPKHVYKFKEHDDVANQKTKKMDNIAKKIDVDEQAKQKKKLKILAIVGAAIALIMLIVFFVVPTVFRVPDIQVPDVSNLTVAEAEVKLTEAGFKVNDEIKQEYHAEIEEGYVIKTNPAAGRLIKRNTEITIYESLGVESFELPDMVGKQVDEVESILEEMGLVVRVEEREMAPGGRLNDGDIIEQRPRAGTTVTSGDTITLITANLVTRMPDMVAEGWDLTMVRNFARENGLTVRDSERVSTTVGEGRVMSQSPAPGTVVVRGSTLTVVIATTPPPPPATPPPPPPTEP